MTTERPESLKGRLAEAIRNPRNSEGRNLERPRPPNQRSIRGPSMKKPPDLVDVTPQSANEKSARRFNAQAASVLP